MAPILTPIFYPALCNGIVYHLPLVFPTPLTNRIYWKKYWTCSKAKPQEALHVSDLSLGSLQPAWDEAQDSPLESKRTPEESPHHYS